MPKHLPIIEVRRRLKQLHWNRCRAILDNIRYMTNDSSVNSQVEWIDRRLENNSIKTPEQFLSELKVIIIYISENCPLNYSRLK